MKTHRLVLAAVAALALVGLARGQEKTTVELVRDVERAIVRIEMKGIVSVTGPGKKVTEGWNASGGTGFLIEGGYIVTNCHVFPGLEPKPKWKVGPNLTVTSRAGTLICELVGSDELADLAVLKIVVGPPKALLDKDGKLPALKFADPKTLQIGQDVVAIGFGRLFEIDGKPSVTRGILSADQRNLDLKSGLLQTDAIINHGNSGGPLLNMRGEVVGVNTYTFDTANGQIVQGMFFARSCETAAPLVQMLIKDKAIRRANLGVTTMSQKHLQVDFYALEAGVIMTGFEKDSPAQAAGLQEYDIIYQINNWYIRNQGDLDSALAFLKPGETIQLRYLRPSKETVERLKKDKVIVQDDALARAVLGREFKTVKVTLK